MDTLLNLQQFGEGSILACVAACGRVDRSGIFNKKLPVPDPEILEQNAGIDRSVSRESRQAQIAEGAFHCLKTLHATAGNLYLSNTWIKKLHRELLQFSPRDEQHRGRYRDELDEEIHALCEVTNRALKHPASHVLFIVSIFRARFLEIMPFITGNGQLANIIAYALLFSRGFTMISGIPIIAALDKPPGNVSGDPLAQLPDTIAHLLKSAHVNQPENNEPDLHTLYLNPRRRGLLEFIKNNPPVKISDIMAHFRDQNRNTIKKDLLFMRDHGMIVAKGVGRGMFYLDAGDRQ